MRFRTLHLAYLVIAAIGAFFILTYEDPINTWESPSGEYGFVPSISEDGIVYFELYDKGDNPIDSIRTGASDFQKWAFGWHDEQDIVILYSSDIGTRAYSVQEDKLSEVSPLTPAIEAKAKALYTERYDTVAH